MISTIDRFRLFAAVYLIVKNKDGQLLLLRRAHTGYKDGFYSCVSGHMDGQETVFDCMKREAQEEAGLILEKPDLEVVHILHRLSPDREYFDIYLKATVWTGIPKIMEPDKADGLDWFSPNNLPSNLIPEVNFALKQINQGNFYSEYGWD